MTPHQTHLLITAAAAVLLTAAAALLLPRLAGYGLRHGPQKIRSFMMTTLRLMTAAVGAAILFQIIGLASYFPILTLASLSALLALSLQQSGANLIAGIQLVRDNRFDLGTWLTVTGGNAGELIDIGPQTTELRTASGARVTIANSLVRGQPIIVLSPLEIAKLHADVTALRAAINAETPAAHV